MRTFLQILSVFLMLGFSSINSHGQIITPSVKANFGVDADLEANYSNTITNPNDDDWFVLPGSSGTGQFIIDTTGAAAINWQYTAIPASRRWSFMKRMRYPVFTILNNKLLMDAAFIRDFHGDDSTVFASGSNKNGDNPANWSCPTSQGIPDKNDILDLMVHVRRAGPFTTDSLWMFGGLSLDNITGNRYFDFEMYQTDLTYNRTTQKFSGYGPDAGHTSWEFDAAGNITKPGDIIFSAEYQSSALTMIEARIWVNVAALSITPAAFDWSGKFDGAYSGATYGYASIKPKSDGAYFTGLQSSITTWGGPFSVVLQNDAVVTDYIAKQYVEFSVNLTKLGLDPAAMGAGNGCAMPFSNLLVKTRSSSSFTAELKDFVLPISFFQPAKADAITATPFLCEKMNIAELSVSNPVSTSTYQWSTTDGNIVSPTTATTVYADKPGTYIVNQFMIEGCPAYAADTIQLLPFPFCGVLLANAIVDFRGNLVDSKAGLTWKVQDNEQAKFFQVQISTDGVNFTNLATLPPNPLSSQYVYSFDWKRQQENEALYVRVALTNSDGSRGLSPVLQLLSSNAGATGVKIYPIPVKNKMALEFSSPAASEVTIAFYSAAGHKLYSTTRLVKAGLNKLSFSSLPELPQGLGFVVIHTGSAVISQKVLFAQ